MKKSIHPFSLGVLGILALSLLMADGAGKTSSTVTSGKPNIILIFADDMGFGDVGCYNMESRIPTPNIDKLAAGGIRFTDAHSADSVCTPSRYGLLTGRYCWRTRLKKGVLFNWEPPLIEVGRMTMASLLKQSGYHTAISGKWHLGLGFTAKEGTTVDFNRPLPWPGGPLPDRNISESIDFSVPVVGGPNALGFDRAYYTAGCSTDQEPFCFIEDGVMLDMKHASYRNPHGSWRSGMASENWKNETVDVKFTEWAVQFIGDTLAQSPNKPFFLYLPLSSPHSPHVTADFALRKSQAGIRGDMVWLVDWATGQIMKKLEELGVADNTLLIVTSDNGPLDGSLAVGETEGMAKITNGHKSMGNWRGRKGRVWEGGHRVPFVARWPEATPAGTVSDHAFVFTDLLATFADLLNTDLPADSGEDGFSILPALLGRSMNARPPIIHHSNTAYAMRSGKWKIVFGQGQNRVLPKEGTGYLFDLETDPFETNNLWTAQPNRVAEMTQEFKSITKDGIYPTP